MHREHRWLSVVLVAGDRWATRGGALDTFAVLVGTLVLGRRAVDVVLCFVLMKVFVWIATASTSLGATSVPKVPAWWLGVMVAREDGLGHHSVL